MTSTKQANVITCIQCGCDDLHACLDGLYEPCYWLRVDSSARVGVCSQCPDSVDKFERVNGWWQLTGEARAAREAVEKECHLIIPSFLRRGD